MKKLYVFLSQLSFVVPLLLLASCSKNYTCSCEVTYYDYYGAVTHTAVNTSSLSGRQSKVEEECAYREWEYESATYTDGTCELIVNP